MTSKASYQRLLPKCISTTMKPCYNSLAKEDEVDIATTPYSDAELKSSSSSTSSAPTLLQNEPSEKTYSSLNPLKQQFIYLALTTLVILLSTIFIVHIGTSSCRAGAPRAQQTIFAPALTAEKEHRKALSLFPSPSKPPKNAESCGPDAATAISKGCHLDLISFTWLPHACYDPELTADFLSLQPWTYSKDQNGTELITPEELKRGEVNTGYVQWEYHLMHCLYTWKKLVRHLERGREMDWYVMQFSHVRHCSGLLVEGLEKKQGEWNSEFFVQFPLCGFA